MTEELRELLRSELSAERPPPLGDLVGTAVRDGRRIRRTRRFAAAGGGTAVLGVVALAMALSGTLRAPAPRSVPPAQAGDVAASAPPVAVPGAVPPQARPGMATPPLVDAFRVKSSGKPAPATPEAMLVLLRELLPPGRTSAYAKAAGGDLHVQMFLDQGYGPGMVRVSVTGLAALGQGPTRVGVPKVSVERLPNNCIQALTVDASFPDGTDVRADVASCLAWNGVRNTAAKPPLTEGQASKLVSNPRWGLTMDANLVMVGARMFPDVPAFG